MTIKELKEKIESLDDNMRVGGSGHFGEFLECWGAKVTEVKERGRFSNKTEMIFRISIEDPGPEPD